MKLAETISQRRRIIVTILGIDGWDIPLVCAPMAYVSHAPLAVAVSRTGALGTMGFGSADSVDFIHDNFQQIPDGLPVGAAFMGWALTKNDDAYYAALEHKPALICLSFGDISTWVKPARDAGAVVVSQVGNINDIEAAIAADVDAIVVRGMEAGGHGRNDVALLPLLAEAKRRSSLPLLAGGGIGSAAGVAAVLEAGATAAWVGTRFITAEESSSSKQARQRLLNATADDTIYTRVFDVAKKLAWPPEFGGRALRTDFVDQWHNRLEELASAPEPYQVTPTYAGQGVGFCSQDETAADIVRELSAKLSSRTGV